MIWHTPTKLGPKNMISNQIFVTLDRNVKTMSQAKPWHCKICNVFIHNKHGISQHVQSPEHAACMRSWALNKQAETNQRSEEALELERIERVIQAELRGGKYALHRCALFFCQTFCVRCPMNDALRVYHRLCV